jgi:hypothetical protein
VPDSVNMSVYLFTEQVCLCTYIYAFCDSLPKITLTFPSLEFTLISRPPKVTTLFICRLQFTCIHLLHTLLFPTSHPRPCDTCNRCFKLQAHKEPPLRTRSPRQTSGPLFAAQTKIFTKYTRVKHSQVGDLAFIHSANIFDKLESRYLGWLH